MASTCAINVKNVIKTYGTKVILDELSMTVERGTIYGLLGASGCGKTTLLSCIVGRKNVDAGEIWILGGRPGEKGGGVPGPKIGYMPQELALVDDFTIKDALFYFGTIFKMEPEEIDERLEYLTKLLELPPSNKFLKHCSGGQKRRVSFAVALVHSPELLILDEPTVGVDPILREKIWGHMRDLVQRKQVTVLITTHYIEETKEATKIGLMRRGKLLVQESPRKLLSSFETHSLEDVFLTLSQRQDNELLNKTSSISVEDLGSSLETVSTSTSVDSFVMGCGSRDELTKSPTKKKSKKDQTAYMSATDLDRSRIKALLDKNWKQFYRNVGGIMFLVTFPIFQMWIFTISIGSDPKQLKLGIVNDEAIMSASCTDFNWNETALYMDDDCQFRNLACRFLTYLEDPMISKVQYESFQKAIDGIKHGEIVGVLHMPTNFSEAYEERIRLGARSDEWITDNGEIKAYMDMSSKLTGAALVVKLNQLFIKFQEKLFVDCHMPKKLADVPIQQNFLYGNEQEPMTVFLTPGMVIMLMYLLGSTMTSQIIVKEKVDGIWDRSIVAGVSSLEITLSHLSFQCVIILVECFELMIMLNFATPIELVGSLWILFFIAYLQGVCGMAYGFFVSTMCGHIGEANLLSTGGYLPLTLICAVLWPLEAMPTILQWISLATPCTVAILSFRNVMVKGWGLWSLHVIDGVAITVGWILIFGVASVWIIKIKR